MINVGVIGCGHWGPNHIRIFSQMPHSRVAMAADVNPARLNLVNKLFPGVTTTTNHREILRNKQIEAVCISSPTNTHFSLTQDALKHGKHVLCEKPLALKPDECLVLKRLAARRRKLLMVGHVFIFNEGIIQMKKYLENGYLGKIFYAHSQRTNLGPFRYDVNALWDLAPHDISIFNFLFERPPVSVSAQGQNYLDTPREDVVFATLQYSKNILVNIHVSWLDPKKVRQITIIGDKRMIVWDDLDNIGPIRLYDKHVERTATFYASYGEFQLLSKEGSITIPRVGIDEPLKNQGQYFIDCIIKNKQPVLAEAAKGYDVVKTLCAIHASIKQNGKRITVR